MADIIITPGSSVMSFTSSGNFTQTITQEASGSLTLQGSGSTGRPDLFTINGNNGTLFSVSDDLSNSLFSVNTIAGLPVIEAFADNTVVMGQYGQNVLVVTGSGVGIGNSNPSGYKFRVSGTSVFENEQTIAYTNAIQTIIGYSGNSLLRMYGNNNGVEVQLDAHSTNSTAGTVGTFSNSDFFIKSNNTSRIAVKAGGNVGIGTTNPSFKLDVVGTLRASDSIRNEANHNNTRYENLLPAAANGSGAGNVQMSWWVSEPGISWNNGGFGYNVTNDGASPYGFGRINTSLGQAYMRFDASGYWYFYNTNTSGTRFETMTLTDTGNVGIGTSSPAEKLDVNGKTKTTTLQVTSGAANGYVLTSDASGNSTWQAAAAGGGGLHIPTKPEVGRVYSLRMNGITFNTSITAANGMRMLPFLPINTLRPSSFSINVSSASSGALIKILVFSDKEGYPFSKLYESTDLDCSTTGIKTSVSNAFQFDAGNTYWVGIIANQSGPVLTGYFTNSVIPISELAVANVAQYLLGATNYPYNNVPSTVYPSEFSPASANAPAVFMST